MSTVCFALRDRLVAQVTETGARIRSLVLEQNPTLPAAVYTLLSDIPTDDISGMAGLFRAEIQYDIFATTPDQAQAVADKFRLALQGYEGTNLTVKILGIHFVTQFDTWEGDINEYRTSIRVAVWYDRENPADSS